MSYEIFNATTNPGTPASGKLNIWENTATKRLSFTDDTGVTGPVGGGPSNWINVTQQGTNSILAGAGAQATANVTNLNAIIAAAPTGSTIYFPTGIWQFNGVITTLPTNLTFQGEFGGTSIYIIANLAANFITCNAAAGYTAFKDMQFFVTVAQTAGAIIETGNGYGVLIERCNIVGNAGGVGTTLFNAISMTGTASGNGVRINDCVIESFSNVGILAAANSFGQFTITNTILNCTTANGLASIQLLGGGALQMVNCDMFGAQYGLALQPSGTVASVLCIQTYFDTCTTRALICGGAGTVTRCEFVACWFTTGGTASTAIEVTTTGAGIHTGLAFRDCTIWNVNGTTGTTNGVLISAVNDLSITDSIVAGWTNGIQVTPVSPNGTTKLNIIGCTVGAAGSVAANTTGILLNVGAVTYGVIAIQDNQFNGNTTNITDNSTSIAGADKLIRNNTGTGNDIYQVRNSAQTVSTSTMVAVSGLTFPITHPSINYSFEAFLPGVAVASTSATAIGVAVSLPAGATINWNVYGNTSTNTAYKNVFLTATSSSSAQSFNTSSGVTGLIHARGVISAGTATSHTGAVSVMLAAQGTATSTNNTVTVQPGAWLNAYKVA